MVICWARAVFLASCLCRVIQCTQCTRSLLIVFVPFSFGVLGNLIVPAPDHCLFIYFANLPGSVARFSLFAAARSSTFYLKMCQAILP